MFFDFVPSLNVPAFKMPTAHDLHGVFEWASGGLKFSISGGFFSFFLWFCIFSIKKNSLTPFGAYLPLVGDIFRDWSVTRRVIIHGGGMGSFYEKRL